MSMALHTFLCWKSFMFERVQICTVSDTLHAFQRPAACTIFPARPVWYRVQTGAAQFVRVRWGCGLHRRGIWGEPGVGRSTPRVEKIQKRRFRRYSCKNPPHLHKTKPIRLCKSPKIPKNTKRPLSELRLWYNQLKAIRQRKEESK